eukprot:SAG31_NODE_1728_length_7428_cov_2.495975_5_plen_165_part_00
MQVEQMPTGSLNLADYLGDLEDLADTTAPDMQRQQKLQVVPKQRRKGNLAASGNAVSTLEGSIPGTHRVHVKTWGCSHNNSDGEYMAGQLASYGYTITSMEDADLWVLNSCTVKNPSEEHFVTDIRRAKAAGKRVVVAGCVPQGEQRHPELADLSILGVQQIDR